MIRGTTPTHIFTFEDLDPSELKTFNIYYAQQGQVIFIKSKDDCTFTSSDEGTKTVYTVSVTLSQEETNLFKAKYEVEIQVRILTNTGDALATPKYRMPVHDVLDDEILT